MATAEQRPGIAQTRKLKVFISYSRADEAFADELRLGLEDKGYTVTIDKHSIRQGEEWKPRLAKLIADCDTVVFVLSPDSARSPICEWEVEEAHRQKRIVPVLHRGLHERPKGTQADGTPWPPGAAMAPERLTLINYPRFDEGRSFMAGLRGLVEALETDHDWIERHSRLASRARDWDEGGRPTNRLMSGVDIKVAKQLVESRKPQSPPTLPVQMDFIQASEAHEAAQTTARERDLEERRRLAEEALAQSRKAELRTRAGLAAALVLALTAGLAGLYAWSQAELANEQAAVAKAETEKARAANAKEQEQRRLALERTKAAEDAERLARSNLANGLKQRALERLGQARYVEAMVLASRAHELHSDPIARNILLQLHNLNPIRYQGLTKGEDQDASSSTERSREANLSSLTKLTAVPCPAALRVNLVKIALVSDCPDKPYNDLQQIVWWIPERGTVVIGGSNERQLEEYNVSDGQLRGEIEIRTQLGALRELWVSRDGRFLVYGTNYHTETWTGETDDASRTAVYDFHKNTQIGFSHERIVSIRFLQHEDGVAALTDSGIVKTYDLRKLSDEFERSDDKAPVEMKPELILRSSVHSIERQSRVLGVREGFGLIVFDGFIVGLLSWGMTIWDLGTGGEVAHAPLPSGEFSDFELERRLGDTLELTIYRGYSPAAPAEHASRISVQINLKSAPRLVPIEEAAFSTRKLRELKSRTCEFLLTVSGCLWCCRFNHTGRRDSACPASFP